MRASPTYAGFLRHARHFGPEMVVETAREYLGEGQLLRLEAEIAAVVRAARRRRFEGKPRMRRRSERETRRLVLELSVEGLVPAAIADKLGLSDSTVRQYLRRTGATGWGAEKAA